MLETTFESGEAVVVQEGGLLVLIWSDEIEKTKGCSGAEVFVVVKYGLVTSTKSVLCVMVVGGAVVLV